MAKALGNLKLTDLSKAAGTAKLTGFLSKKMRHYDAKNNLVKEKDVISYLNSTFQALNALTTNTKSTSKHLKLLGENYKTHSKNSSIFYENIVTSKKSFFKVFIDSGKGFNEKQTIVFPVQGKMHSWDLKKISKYKTIQRVKLTPANTACIIKLEYLGIDFIKKTTYELDTNAYLVEDNIYYFETEYPEITIELKDPVGIEKLVVSLEYIDRGESVYSAIKAVDARRLLKAKSLELESRDEVIQEREEHILANDQEIVELKKIITELKQINDKTEKELRASIEAELADKEIISKSLNEALEAEKLDKDAIKASLHQALEAEQKDKEDLKRSLEAALNAERADKAKVIKELEKAISSEQKDKQKVEGNLLKAVEAEKIEQFRIKEQVSNEYREILRLSLIHI